MPSRHVTSLWLRLALPFLLFVAVGSTALVVWRQAAVRRESRRAFATLAQTNADLIRSVRLPMTERTADYLSRVLNVRVLFRERHTDGAAWTPAPDGMLAEIGEPLARLEPLAGVVRLGQQWEAVALPVERGVDLLLVRMVEPMWQSLLRGETLPLLGAFGLLSVALAWALARGIVRPLRQLAQRLPQIEHDPVATLPGAERRDEIGQLARSYLGTRAQLAEERVRRARAERLAVLGRMATGLAHEIHNPLAAIRMHAQLLESAPAGELAATASEALPAMLGETAKIEGLVQQWMFLARPEPPQTTRTDLADLVTETLRAVAPQAAHAGVLLVNEAPAPLPVRVDARRIAQVLGNIALNAIQAMPDGGTLTIRGACADTVRLVFCDTGRGFTAGALARHAELFFSEKEGGMGIGLSVAAEIMKAHGGTLTVANAEEAGAVVTLDFPLADRVENRKPDGA